MIESFYFSYGYNKISSQNSGKANYSYNDYCALINMLTKGIEKLPLYQKALIYNYNHFTNAVSTLELLPRLIDSISLFLYTLFCYGDDINSGYIIAATEAMEGLTDQIAQHRNEQEFITKETKYLKGEFSFERVMGDVFKFLSQDFPRDESHVYKPYSDNIISTDFVNLITETFQEFNDKKPYSEIEEILNQKTAEFYNTHQYPYDILMSNLENERYYSESFWTAKSVAGRLSLATIYTCKEEVTRTISIMREFRDSCKSSDGEYPNAEYLKGHYEEYVNKKIHNSCKSTSSENLEYTPDDMTWCYIHYDIIEEFFDQNPQTDEEISDFIERSVKKRCEIAIKESETQDELNEKNHVDFIRPIGFYNQAQSSKLFESIHENITQVINDIIPYKLKY